MSAVAQIDILSTTDKMALHSIEEKGLRLYPEFDDDYGVRYPEAERIFELDPDEASKKLEALYQHEYLRRQLQSNYMKCPTCEAFKLLVQLKCPHCNSLQVSRGLLFEHYDCGYQGFREDFVQGDIYICPKCGKELQQVGVDFRRVGVWYHCQECDEYFGTPQETYLCLECNERHLIDELVLKPVYRYEGNPEQIKEIILGIELDELADELGGYGDMEIFGELKGKSGVSHVFTLLFEEWNTGKKSAVEIKFSDKPVPMREITSFYAKLNDIEGVEGVLLAVPSLSEEARNLARSLEVSVIEAREPEKILGDLEKILLGENSDV